MSQLKKLKAIYEEGVKQKKRAAERHLRKLIDRILREVEVACSNGDSRATLYLTHNECELIKSTQLCERLRTEYGLRAHIDLVTSPTIRDCLHVAGWAD